MEQLARVSPDNAPAPASHSVVITPLSVDWRMASFAVVVLVSETVSLEVVTAARRISLEPSASAIVWLEFVAAVQHIAPELLALEIASTESVAAVPAALGLSEAVSFAARMFSATESVTESGSESALASGIVSPGCISFVRGPLEQRTMQPALQQ